METVLRSPVLCDSFHFRKVDDFVSTIAATDSMLPGILQMVMPTPDPNIIKPVTVIFSFSINLKTVFLQRLIVNPLFQAIE
jgi:hypothetical protein